MKNKFSKLIVFYICVIIFPSVAFAQGMPISYSVSDLKGFNRSVFDIHFNRADRELSPERWLYEAKYGINQALCAWELYASALFDSSFKLEEAKIQIENWCNEELEIRFSKWLTERFFGELAEKSISDLHAMLAVTNDDLSDESFDWRSEKKDYIIASGNAVTDNLNYLYVELLDYIPSEMRESMKNIIIDSAAKTGNLLKSEFENIAARQERIFARRRMPEQLSVENQSYLTKQEARYLADQLVIETEEFCSLGINEIKVKIEKASAGTDDLALLGDEWLQLYKEQFERGLKAWQDAEERFFMRRIEWEQETFKVYSEGEDVWYEAFINFENKRNEWEMLIKELLEEGEKHFKNISENFERNIAEAKAEFEVNTAIRAGTVSTKIKALSDMYLVFISAANSVRENILFKQKNIYSNSVKDLQDEDFFEWLSVQRKNLWQLALNKYSQKSNLRSDLKKLETLQKKIDDEREKKIITEGKKEEEIKAEIEEKEKRIEAAVEAYNDHFEYLQTNYVPYYKIPKMINGEFSIEEELLYLKEIEKLRLLNSQYFNRCYDLHESYDLYLSYLEKAAEVRDVIISDFGEIFGDSKLKDILLKNMSSEDFCLDEYQIALIQANTLVQYWERKTHIAEVVTKLSSDYENGLIKEEDIYNAWNEVKTAYEESIILYNKELDKLSNISGDIFTQQQILDNLSQTMKLEEDKLAKLNSQYSALLTANTVGQSSFISNDLKNKYAQLVNEYERLFETGDNASYKDLLEYGMKYSLAEQSEAAKNILNILINGNNIDIQPLSELKKNAPDNDIDIKLRLAAIDMFADNDTNQLRGQDSSYSSADWYFKAKGISSVDFNTELLYGENLGFQLAGDLYNITKKLYEKRLELELAAFQEYLGEISDTNEYETGLQIYTTLLNLQNFIINNGLNNIDNENEIISSFLSGRLFLISGTEENLPDLYNEYRYCSGLLEIYSNYTGINSFSSKEIWRQSITKLQKFFNDNGINLNNNYLPDAEIICNFITGKSENVLHNASLFFIEFNNCFSQLPALLNNEIFNWQQSIFKYIAAYIFVNNISINGLSSIPEEKNIEKNIIFILESLIKEYSTDEKFWRQFLSEGYIIEYDYKIIWKPDLSTGLLTDILEIANYYTNRLRDSFTIYSNGNIDFSSANKNMLYYLYSNEVNKANQELNNLNYFKNEISRIGAAFDYINLPYYEVDFELIKISDAVKKQEDVFNGLRDEYMSAAANFQKYGEDYNEQYGLVKSIYNESNKKRYEYELQDTIIRYISTIYMDFELLDLKQCKEKLNRAKIVLEVLTDLYTDQKMRPYQNNEYYELYSAYEQSYSVRMLTMKAFKLINDEVTRANEFYNGEYYYFIYYLNNLGNVDQNYSGYISSDNRGEWTIKDIITINNGRLAFSLSENTLTGVNETTADALVDYFSDIEKSDDIINQFSKFQDALCGLSQRMAVYFSNPEKYKQWSLLREYLLSEISSNNNDLNFLINYISGLGELDENGSLSSLPVKKDTISSATELNKIVLKNRNELLDDDLINLMWISLSEDERADLEFYTILTLSAGNYHYSKGFSLAYTLDIYNDAHNAIERIIDKYEDKNDIPIIGFFYSLADKELLEVNKNTLSKVDLIKYQTEKDYNYWVSCLNENIQRISYGIMCYQDAIDYLGTFYFNKGYNEGITWDEIENALVSTRKFTSDEFNVLMDCWNRMQIEYNEKYKTLDSALKGLFYWAKSIEEQNKAAFENQWLQNERQRLVYETNFNKLLEDFINGNVSQTDLRTAADAAYGVNAAAWKNHFVNLQDSLFDHLFNQNIENDYNNEINNVVNELILLSQLTMNSRYNAELSSREIEWEQMRRELNNNYDEWLKIAAMLVEKGRKDWAAGKTKMEDAYLSWTQNFKDEYNRVNDEWADVYLVSLLDKQQWVESAAKAAEEASDNQYLLYMGTEAERLSRLMDTREPLGFYINIQNANNILNEVLYYHGISNIYNALNVINNIANISSPLVKRGIGGISMWNASLVKLNASDTIKQANKVIADNEAAKLAYEASVTASKVIVSIYDYVKNANSEFRKSMDDHFIINGFWTRSGNDYVKDVVIGSTLTKPVITERHTIIGYKDYVVEQLSIKTRTDTEYLKNLESLAIIGLIENVYAEVEQIIKDIFGVGEDSIKINKDGINKKKVKSFIDGQLITNYMDDIVKLDEREQAPGKFGAYIGYQPAVKSSEYMGKTRDTIFFDEGEGELGRLLSDYIYWSVIEGKGMAELTLSFWDKRMWDDAGTLFNAPTIRGTAQTAAAIAGTVVAVALAPVSGGASFGAAAAIISATAAVSSSADFFFNTLDAGFGYKKWDEALFESTKTYVTNFASSAISMGTGEMTKGALKTVTSGAGNVLIKTSMAGASAAYSTIATSVISGIKYNHNDGWSYSNEIVSAGMNKLLTNTLTSMTSSFVSSGLEMINTGWNGNKVTNFSGQNIKDLEKFNGLIGDLAGQGVNYALGNDFTLNLLNMSLLSNDRISSGLLELHLGHDNSPTMNIGTGGANISIYNLYHAFNGALVWNENIQNDIFKKKTNIDISAAFRGVYGFGDKTAKKLVKDLRSGKTDLEAKSDEDYFAKTINSDGKLKLILGRYADGMTSEEQLYLAAILQHEAYRDGLKEGDINKYGHIISFEDSFDELKTASIARIEMAKRINADYNWFLDANDDLQFEEILLSYAKDTGDYSLYNDYLQFALNNENDYYFLWASTNGDLQSNYKGIPLINSVEETRIKNEQRLQKGFEKYKLDMSDSKETEESLWKTYSSDIKIQTKYGGNPLDVETISLLGCMFMSTKYGIEALTGVQVNTIELNDFIRENKLFNGESNLSSKLMADIMTKYTNGAYNVTLALSQTGSMSVEALYDLYQSKDMYLVHLRVKTGETWDHSVMLSMIDFTYDDDKKLTGIRGVHVANPSNNPNKITGKTFYTMDQISRWDIFSVTSSKPAVTVSASDIAREKMYIKRMK